MAAVAIRQMAHYLFLPPVADGQRSVDDLIYFRSAACSVITCSVMAAASASAALMNQFILLSCQNVHTVLVVVLRNAKIRDATASPHLAFWVAAFRLRQHRLLLAGGGGGLIPFIAGSASKSISIAHQAAEEEMNQITGVDVIAAVSPPRWRHNGELRSRFQELMDWPLGDDLESYQMDHSLLQRGLPRTITKKCFDFLRFLRMLLDRRC